MSIVAGVPVEILCEIFRLLCHQPIRLDVLHNPDTTGFPWAVGRVCRLWREAFVSCPSLWTSLSLTSYILDGSTWPRNSSLPEMNRRAALYLARSGKLLLMISIYLRSSHRHPSVPSKVLEMLVSCSNRWKSLGLNVNSQSDMDFFSECRGKMPILSHLEIFSAGYRQTFSLQTFEVVPRLTELYLRRVDEMKKVHFPWAQLTKIHLWHCSDGRDLLELLMQSQNLEVLVLLCVGGLRTRYNLPPRTDLPPIRLSHLRSFETTCDPVVFSWFTTPLLEHLQLKDYIPHQTSLGREISSLVNRSSCHIRRLTLLRGRINMTPEMSKALADVEELVISQCAEGKNLPHILKCIVQSDDLTCFPNLRVLKISFCPAHDDWIGEFSAELSYLLEVRGGGSRLALASCDTVPLERLVIRLVWCHRGHKQISHDSIPYDTLEAIQRCNVDVFIDDSEVKQRLEYIACTPRGLGSTVILPWCN